LQNGFLEGYSQASIEEDFNKFVDWAFTKPDRLRRLASRYQRIRKKYNIVIKFYESIDPKIDIPRIIPDAEGHNREHRGGGFGLYTSVRDHHLSRPTLFFVPVAIQASKMQQSAGRNDACGYPSVKYHKPKNRLLHTRC
jgi:hypothetical protein